MVAPPPQIIEGMLHQGCQMILGAGARVDECVVRWDYLRMLLAKVLNPGCAASARSVFTYSLTRENKLMIHD